MALTRSAAVQNLLSKPSGSCTLSWLLPFAPATSEATRAGACYWAVVT